MIFLSFLLLGCIKGVVLGNDDCRLYLSESKVRPNEWGIFVGRNVKRGMAVSTPDMILQLTDFFSSIVDDSHVFTMDGYETGGQYEGRDVASFIPGIGMLAQRSNSSSSSNVMGFRPTVDEGNLPRTTSPASGSFTHYYNYTFYATHPLTAGTELILRSYNKTTTNTATTTKKNTPSFYSQEMSYLRQNGYCLDSLRMTSSSTNEKNNRGRGAISTKYIREGDVIMVSPMLKLSSSNMTYSIPPKKKKKNKSSSSSSSSSNNNRTQLIMNYCFINETNNNNDDDIEYYFPMAPMVNFINHHEDKYNVRVQWSKTNLHGIPLLEYIATETILPGQQVFLDYGNAWQTAWQHHVQHWKPIHVDNDRYTPSYIMDDVASIIRTQKEQSQQNYPYPSNVQTSCFFQYQQPDNYSTSSNSDKTTTIPWNHTRETFYFHNLYPCDILDRTSHSKHHHTYMVRMKNLPYAKDKVFPTTPNQYIIVSKVPRQAIRFTDKFYTTDQHLANVFRRPIHIPSSTKYNTQKDEL